MTYDMVRSVTGKDTPGYVFLKKKIHLLYSSYTSWGKRGFGGGVVYIGCHSCSSLTEKLKTFSYLQAIHVKTAS